MTTFLDGPAAGKSLTLHRTPQFLRVVDNCGQWDALDQPDDAPELSETIYAYRVRRVLGSAFIDGQDRQGRRRGFRIAIVEYQHVEPQPDQATMRSQDGWAQWCEAQPKRNTPWPTPPT